MVEKNCQKVHAMDLFHQIPSEMLVPIRVEIETDSVRIFTTVEKGSSQEEDALVVMKQLCEDLCNKDIPHDPQERTVEGRNRIDCIVIKPQDKMKV